MHAHSSLDRKQPQRSSQCATNHQSSSRTVNQPQIATPLMRATPLLALLALSGLLALVVAQPNTPETYNSNGAHRSSSDPCADISVQRWTDVPASRRTLDPNFDEGVPADYASVWTGNDGLNLYPNGFRKGQVYEDNNPPFCFRVEGVQSRFVQVMVQTLDDQARLCIRDASKNSVRAGGAIDRCFTDKMTACFGGLTYSNSLTLMLYTDGSGAATTATPFWYRVRTSSVSWDLSNPADRANSALANLESWCAVQDVLGESDMRFPKELRSVVPPAMIKTTVAPSSPAAAAATPVAMIVAALVALAVMLARK